MAQHRWEFSIPNPADSRHFITGPCQGGSSCGIKPQPDTFQIWLVLQEEAAGAKRPRIEVELKDLCMRTDTFPSGGPHVRRLAVSLQALEVWMWFRVGGLGCRGNVTRHA